ncbi:MAG TPA: MaoC/PaaZ C-terminal domain-containing protein [Anaerolineales bacterium]|nr:MaoC/PaaZ C-terminal domain-containing protein [Anaerolineales bacterium]
MSITQPEVRGLYFEDFAVGMSILSPARTITESDIVAFAGLSGDFNQIHTDAEYSQSTPFGQRVAHGLLGLSIASGLAVRTGVIEGTVLAWREINEWKFVKPVLIGDTIHVVLLVVETKSMRGTGGGAVTIEVRVVNQKDEVVMKGSWKMLVVSRG